ncbi:MAG: hypothetical protein DI535_24930 [Citrobacter freundii]|nr:MAG: hypothetical protein DI535_24930 [Citrobacter freundii]
MTTYRFIKEPTGWYVDLPEFIAQGGTKDALQMVEGADVMLDIIADGKDSVLLDIDLNPFPAAVKLTLTEKCDPYIGGGYYLMNEWDGRKLNLTMWLCAVTEWVFGDLPAVIFIRENKNTSAV